MVPINKKAIENIIKAMDFIILDELSLIIKKM
jgi:hypothetical protein